jgi:hypothetical protein
MPPRWSTIAALALCACGSSSAAPVATTTEPAGPRPVRIDEPSAASAGGPHPVRVAPTIPGEAAEQDDLADPPPVEAPVP